MASPSAHRIKRNSEDCENCELYLPIAKGMISEKSSNVNKNLIYYFYLKNSLLLTMFIFFCYLNKADI